jgi:predicted CopG family antitoxin
MQMIVTIPISLDLYCRILERAAKEKRDFTDLLAEYLEEAQLSYEHKEKFVDELFKKP